MHNLSTVIRFEIVRTLKKKSYWVMALGFPVMMMAIFSIIYFSNQSTNKAAEELQNQSFSIEVTDETHLIKPSILSALKAKTIDNKQQGINDVESGKVDSYIYYPSDISKQAVEVYGQDVGIFNNSRYDAVAGMIMKESIQNSVNPNIRSVIGGTAQTNVTTYRDGEAYDPFKQMILPGLFLVLFYMLIAFSANQMLTSTIEEKENRVIEMILTTIEARTLVIGKIVSQVALSLLQGCIIVLPALAGYFLFHDKLNLPFVDLTTLPVNILRILTGALVFAVSFMFFTGILVLIGSSVPTAKEASQFLGVVMIAIFGPLYAVSLFISAPDAPLVRFLSLFPLTAPIPLLLRNAVGNLHPWELAVALPILIASAAFVLMLAVRVFRYGALEYSRKVSLREIFGRR
jgi:ABC-2 type transport system permease protein